MLFPLAMMTVLQDADSKSTAHSEGAVNLLKFAIFASGYWCGLFRLLSL